MTINSFNEKYNFLLIAIALQTANFQYGATDQFRALIDIQPNMPLVVTEFWTGW